MNYPDATHLENTLARACPTTQHAAIIMSERDQLGRERYGQDVDDNPLTAAQWAQHAVEEAADGLKYAIRAREEAEKIEMEVQALRTANAALVERVQRLDLAGSIALGYAAKGDWESADEAWKNARGQP